MDILQTLQQLRDDVKTLVANNLNALNAKIDEKTISIDGELNSTSTNPVQNKVITTEINNINKRVGSTSVANQISSAIANQPHFSGDYNDLINAPNITENNVGNMVIADELGNIIFKIDSNGAHTTNISLDGKNAATEEFVSAKIAEAQLEGNDVDLSNYATKKYVDNAVDSIEIPETDLTGYATEIYVTTAINNINIPEVNLDNYYTKDETDSVIESEKKELSESIVSESEEWHIVDSNGNIVATIDASGIATTRVATDMLTINGLDIEELIAAMVQTYVEEAILGGAW